MTTSTPATTEKSPSRLLSFLRGKSQSDLEHIASQAKTSVGNLMQVAYGHGACSSAMARAISAATSWTVTPHQIAPKHFPYPKDGLPPKKRSAG